MQFSLLLLLLLVTSPVFAADFFVSPSGSGNTCSSGIPCSLTTGQSQATGPGDSLILKDGRYATGANGLIITKSGTPTNYFTVRGENHQGARLTANNSASSVMAVRANYVRVGGVGTGLIIDGDNAVTPDGVADAGDGGGFRVGYSTVPAPARHHHVEVTDNIIRNMQASCVIATTGEDNLKFLRNTISDCGEVLFNGEGIYIAPATSTLSRVTSNIEIAYNDISGFTEDGLDLKAYSHHVNFHHNIVHDQAECRDYASCNFPDNPNDSTINVTGCSHTISHNIFYNVKTTGGIFNVVANNLGNIFNNVVDNALTSAFTNSSQPIIDVNPASGALCNQFGQPTGTTVIRDNAFKDMQWAKSGVFRNPTAAGFTFTGNAGDSDDTESNDIATTQTGNLNVNNTDGFDFINEGGRDYNIASTSDLFQAGSTTANFNGTKNDIGVSEPPRFASCEVGQVDASTLVLNLKENNSLHQPLLPATGCSGFTIRENAGGKTISSCTRSGNTQMRFALATPFTVGTTPDIAHTFSNVTNSALVGNTQNTRLVDFTSTVGACLNNISAAVPILTQRLSRCESHGRVIDVPDFLIADCRVVAGGQIAARVSIDAATQAVAAAGYAPYAQKNGTGGFFQIGNTCASSGICFARPPDFIGTVPTTAQLDVGGTFVVGAVQTSFAEVPSIALPVGAHTELVATLGVGGDVSDGDYFDIRWYRAGTPLDSYPVAGMPRVTVGAGVGLRVR